jgi:hypothetical protein
MLMGTTFRDTKRYYHSLFSPYSFPRETFLPYWIPARRQVVIYTSRGNREVGSIGPGGFTPVGSGRGSTFEEDLVNWQGLTGNAGKWFLPFKHSLYLLNIEERQITRVFSTTAADGIRGVVFANWYLEPQNRLLGVLTKERVHLFTSGGKELFSTPLERRGSDDFDLYLLATTGNKRIFLWYGNSETRANEPVGTISEFSIQGEKLADYSLPSLSGLNPRIVSTPYWYESAAMMLEAPAVVLGGGYAYSVYDAQANPDTLSAENLGEFLRHFLGTLFVSLICAPLSFLVARRAALNKGAAWGWALATLPLGLSALLLLLALRGWPTLVPCPNCGKKRNVEREKCEHCGADFPAPVPDETSIFEERLAEREMEVLTHRG